MSSAHKLDGFNRRGIEFVLTELDTALTFARIAQENPNDPEKRERNRSHAQKAYETLQEMVGRFSFAPEDAKRLEVNMNRLKTDLEQLKISRPPARSPVHSKTHNS